MLMDLLPLHVENKLIAFMLFEEDSLDDELCWVMEISGTVSITFAYDIVEKNEVLANDFIWKQIWKLQVPNWIQVFLWLVKHGKIMSNTERMRLGLTMNGLYPMCQNG